MTASKAKDAGPIRVLRWMALVTGLVLAGFVTRGLIVTGLGAEQVVLMVFAALFLLVALLARLIGARGTLACSAVIYPLLALFTWSPDIILRRVKAARPTWDRPLDMHARDARFCYKHIPSKTTIHEMEEFKVEYSIDAQGCRVTPTPEQPLGTIAILGCSFAFGHGVNDDESLAHILGQRYWRRYKVRNRAVMGWGTTHSYLALEDELKRVPPPRVALYLWITDHTMRSYIRKEYLEELPFPSPHFELEDDQLVLKGYVGPDKGVQASPELANKELTLCAAMIREMHRQSRQRSTSFFVVFLSKNHGKPARSDYPELIALLDEYEVPYIDLSRVGRGMFYPKDEHPNKEWHRAVARALARSARLAPLLEK